MGAVRGALGGSARCSAGALTMVLMDGRRV